MLGFLMDFHEVHEVPQPNAGELKTPALTPKGRKRRVGVRNPIAGVAAGSPGYEAAKARRYRQAQRDRAQVLRTGKSVIPDPGTLTAVWALMYPGSGRLPLEAQNVQNVADFIESQRPGTLTLGPASRYISIYEVARELRISETRTLQWLRELGVRALDIGGLQYIMLFDVEFACWKRTRPPGSDTSDAAFLRFLDSVGPRYCGLQRLTVERRLKNAIATVAAAGTPVCRVTEPDSGVEQDAAVDTTETPDSND